MSFRESLSTVFSRLPELVLAKDGSVSQTKLAAACFHLLLMLAVIAHTVAKGFVFDTEVWGVYGFFATGHAIIDKAQGIKSTKAPSEPPLP